MKTCDIEKMQYALTSIKDIITELRERNPNVVDCVRDAIGMIENNVNYALDSETKEA